jgi:tetratricopeptide (TPR) repeat protein
MRRPRPGFVCQIGLLSLIWVLSGCSSTRKVEQARALVAQGRPEESIRLLDRQLPKIHDQKTLSRAYLVQGDALALVGRVPEAFSSYQKAMDADPAAIEPQCRTAELLIATGNSPKARKLTEALAASHPLEAQILQLHGAALAGAGDLRAAESIYRKAIAVRASDGDLVISLAELLLRQDREDEARQVLLKAAETGKAPSAWLALGRLDEQQGNPLGAEVAYRRAVHVADTPETNLRLAQFLQRAAKISEAKAVLSHVDELKRNTVAGADLSFVLGQTVSALESYVRTLHTPDNKAVDDQQAMASRVVEAALYERQRAVPARVRNARIMLAQTLPRLDEGTRAILETEIAITAGEISTAESSSRRALIYQPRSGAAHYLRGVVLDMRGDEAATSEWEEAVRLDDHIPSRMLLAQTALRRGELDKAQEHIAAVVREEPANLEALLIYARALEREREFDAAQSIVNRALIIDPGSAEANVIAGNISMQRKAKGAAFIAYEKALLFNGRSAEGISGLLNVFAQGRLTRASIARIERMAAAPPASAMLYEVAGRLYQLGGLKSDAQRALRRSLALDAQRPTAELALWKTGARDVALGPSGGNATLDDFERSAAQGDNTGIAANNLAFAYAERGVQLKSALDLSLDAIQRMPSKAEPMDTLGFVLLKMRQYSAAANAFERALELSPAPPARRRILLHLADAYQAGGEDTKADSARAAAGRLPG